NTATSRSVCHRISSELFEGVVTDEEFAGDPVANGTARGGVEAGGAGDDSRAGRDGQRAGAVGRAAGAAAQRGGGSARARRASAGQRDERGAAVCQGQGGAAASVASVS